MTASFYDVALPVPLRQTFTYAVPGALSRDVVPGCRVVVPFRRKAMIAVALDKRDRAPNVGEIREIVETLDPLPALTPQLIELGRWIAGYYLAPIGEVFRTMLPPTVEVRAAAEAGLRKHRLDGRAVRMAAHQELSMRITFERSGGFAGLLIKKEFDLDDLPDEIEDALKEMLKSADFFAPPACLPSKGVLPDSFSYVITAQSEKGTHAVAFRDGDITDNLRPLVDKLWQLARQRK